MLHVVMVIRDFFMQLNPAVYYITDHYRNAPYVLVRLSAAWQPMGAVIFTWRGRSDQKTP